MALTTRDRTPLMLGASDVKPDWDGSNVTTPPDCAPAKYYAMWYVMGEFHIAYIAISINSIHQLQPVQ